VVEGHEAVRRAICLYLSQLRAVGGMATAEDGDRALALAPVFRPDLILVDLKEPRTNGIETIQKMRGLGGQPFIVAISADGELRKTALAAGADAFVDKIDLARRLEDLVAGREGLER
jgi:CheY-like chemotaxis protein